MLVICGLSGCGKSTLIKECLVDQPHLQHVVASDLLKQSGRPAQNLNISQAYDNQKILKSWYPSFKDNVVFDGHLLIETIEGPFLIPDETFDGVYLNKVVHISRDESFMQRTRADRMQRNGLIPFADLSNIELAHAKRIAYIAECELITFDETNVSRGIRYLLRKLS